MTTRTFTQRFASGLVSAFVVLGVGAATFVPSDAHASVDAAVCQVHEVLMSKEGDGKIPKNLAFLSKTLQEDAFAVYRGYHLVDKKRLRLAADATSTFQSGHKLALKLVGGDDKRLRINLELTARDGQKQLVKTEYSQEDNGLFLIQAGTGSSGAISGKLFFTFQCARA